MSLANRIRERSRIVAQTWQALRTALTTPLPPISKKEIGLMTRDEYLTYRNPTDKHHPEDAYETTLKALNRSLHFTGTQQKEGDTFSLLRSDHGYVIEREGTPVAVLHQGTMYHKNGMGRSSIPTYFNDGSKTIDLDIQVRKPVKYLEDSLALVDRVAEKNLSEYPLVLRRLQLGREAFVVRAEAPVQPGAGSTLVILNPLGEIVASATNEWGATLLRVAKEYQGKGLGKVLGKLWYEYNPDFQSGGFTSSGETAAIGLWEDRVQEFLSHGWYSELIRQGRLPTERVKEIIRDLRGRPSRSPLPEPVTTQPQNKHQRLVYVQDSAFVVYDSRFLTDQDEKYIHGYGFFRDHPSVGTFLYRIDYDRPYQRSTTMVALQLAKDNDHPLYVGKGYGDIVELDGIPHIQRDGDSVSITTDLLPLKTMADLERKSRKPLDRYGELEQSLVEMAESKWD